MKVIVLDGTERFFVCYKCQNEEPIDWTEIEDRSEIECTECGAEIMIRVDYEDVD
jgi:DNA-directed RNA polymerase subunit RPC12/RpoP